ncbi:hypothetical protein GCM10022218_32110 [Sphingobacterium ginsenosidimutans]|uniref:Uncharacterized protein n=1 Tax=Sphingobacterium ginsenosidimutans TaxID=687845 RepID=A0ABP8A7W8_9SPHI
MIMRFIELCFHGCHLAANVRIAAWDKGKPQDIGDQYENNYSHYYTNLEKYFKNLFFYNNIA